MARDLDTQEMIKRLKALEDENAKLKKKAYASSEPLTVTESEYKGHPTLTFEGPCKPFSLGVKKLSIVKQGWPQVEAFLKKHAKSGESNSSDFDDDKI
ncbi:MAG: hypothetical protein AB7Y74_08045 [Syntrophorhabdus sp.]